MKRTATKVFHVTDDLLAAHRTNKIGGQKLSAIARILESDYMNKNIVSYWFMSWDRWFLYQFIHLEQVRKKKWIGLDSKSVELCVMNRYGGRAWPLLYAYLNCNKTTLSVTQRKEKRGNRPQTDWKSELTLKLN
jgi:hypothetical protein